MFLFGFPHLNKDSLEQIKFGLSLECMLIATVVIKLTKEVFNHFLITTKIKFCITFLLSLHFDLIENYKLFSSKNINWVFLRCIFIFFVLCWLFNHSTLLSSDLINCFLIFAEQNSCKLFLNHSSKHKCIDGDCDTLNRDQEASN